MKNAAVIDVMYNDLTHDKGALWLYGNILKGLPQLMPDLISLWLKTRARTHQVPFLEFEPLLDRSLLDIRQEYDLLLLFK